MKSAGNKNEVKKGYIVKTDRGTHEKQRWKLLEKNRVLYEFTSQSVSSVTQSCPALCDPMNHSTPGLPVHHQLPESIQTHVHCVGDAIQPSHPLLSSSPPALNLSQHQGLSTSAGRSIGVSASTLLPPMNTQDWSLGWTGWISLQSKGLSRVFSNITVQKHPRDSQESSPTPQFKSSLVLSFLHSSTLPSIHDHRKNHSLD